MYKIQLLSCIALTLALVANGAPTSSSTGNTMKEVKSLLLDLQLLLEKVKNPENLKLSRMHTFDFYVPKVNATELKHLKCLLEELKLLEEVLNLAPSKNLNPREIKDSMDNIKRIVLELQVTNCGSGKCKLEGLYLPSTQGHFVTPHINTKLGLGEDTELNFKERRQVSLYTGSETRFTCEYDDATVNAVEFLNKWITFCQSIYSTMT